MLRPERMSRVSVTGSKAVMDDVVSTVHDLQLFDVTDYDGEWEGFTPGDPAEGADDASTKLVTVRSLQSILGVAPDEYDGPTRHLDDDELDDELASVRERVNALDDRRDELDDELRAVEERLAAAEPFVELGIDLDLLHGYENLTVTVGQGDRDDIRRALVESDEVDRYEIFGEGDTLAVFAYPADAALEDALVGATFASLEIPDTDAGPEGYVEQLRDRKRDLEAELDDVAAELAEVREEVSGFLLAAEERLAIDVQQREAPLSFATTENAFVAEGWLLTERFVDLAEGLQDAVGDHVEIEELERADYDEHGFATGPADEVAGDAGGDPVAADGGHVEGDQPMSGGAPPVVQDNSGAVKPFEALVEIINKPKYSELDPAVVLFLTFPLFFGFMIGDLGYGLLYMGLGYALVSQFDSDVINALGGIGLLSGLFTVVFGVLYGEFFGLHQLGDILWAGHPPIHKGLQPHFIKYAQAWLLLSVVAGVLHMAVGRSFDFVNNLSHGVGEAVEESGSWILLTVGLWVWVFSTVGDSAKPGFMFEVLASGEKAAIPLGYTGFSPAVGWAGLAIAAVGFVLALRAEGGIVIIESITQAFGHVISYTRLAAVLLAKAGMALAVNLLTFGAYAHDGEFHLIWFTSAEEMAEVPAEEIVFSGLFNLGASDGTSIAIVALGALFGLVVLVLGHVLVLVLGITSAGLQAVRLEYVEFFGKFYEGGGRDYEPFGYERRFTTEQ
ncbi:V-type ATP synthase subunit I [Halobacteriales archaeon QH_7_66_36]|nr:MAG: V-type ATP synthase subunit I [Halobacteriales archaeon QH_7_66_36]